VDSANCQGTRGAATCETGLCATREIADDSGCGPAVVANECDAYSDLVCTGSSSQAAPTGCPSTCYLPGDCDPGAECRDRVCAEAAGDAQMPARAAPRTKKAPARARERVPTPLEPAPELAGCDDGMAPFAGGCAPVLCWLEGAAGDVASCSLSLGPGESDGGETLLAAELGLAWDPAAVASVRTGAEQPDREISEAVRLDLEPADLDLPGRVQISTCVSEACAPGRLEVLLWARPVGEDEPMDARAALHFELATDGPVPVLLDPAATGDGVRADSSLAHIVVEPVGNRLVRIRPEPLQR